MIDLHVHTRHSDGRLPPAEVIEEAARRGVTALSIVDHDVLTGLPEAQVAADRLGVELVPGIEMTARWQGRRPVHVLGYFVDTEDSALLHARGRARALMAKHVDMVLAAIHELGFELEIRDLDRYRNRYAGGAALVFGMLERGVLAKAPAGTGMRLLRMAAEEPQAYTVAEAVELIHGAGGVASLAHPARLKRGEMLLSAEALAPLVAQGFDAIEAWQWIPNGWGSDHYQAAAAELGAGVSGGSDDHGKRTSDGRMRLGSQPVPRAVLEALRAEAQSRRARA